MTDLYTRGMSVDQLVERSGNPLLSSEDSRKVAAEINRRLIEALNASKESAEKSGNKILFLTWILIVLTFVLVFTEFQPTAGTEHMQWGHDGNNVEINF